MASGAEPSPVRAPADLERAYDVCPLSTRQGVPKGHPGTNVVAGPGLATFGVGGAVLRLESLIRPPAQAGDLPAKAATGEPAALTAARLVSAADGRAVFTGTAADGNRLTVRLTAATDGVIRVSLGRDGTERPRSQAALALVRDLPPYAGAIHTERAGSGVRRGR